jgi:hypothetical protein
MVFSLGETSDRVDMRMNRDAGGLAMSSSQIRIETRETAMVVLGELLIVGGTAIVVASGIFWAWASYKQKLLRGPEEDSSHPPEVPTP